MNSKIQQLLGRLPFLKKLRLGKGLTFFRWILFSIFGTVVLSILSGVVWFHFHPLDEYRGKIEQVLKSALIADEISIEKIKWNFAPASLGLGFRMESVTVKGSSFVKELQAPSVDVLMEPLMLITGKLPLKVRLVDSQWISLDSVVSPNLLNEKSSKTSILNNVLNSTLYSNWAKRIRLKIQFENSQFSFSPSAFGLASSTSLMKTYATDFETSIVGFPGQFSGSMKGEIDLIMNGRSFRAKGPMKVRFDGYTQLIGSRPVGLFFEQMDADLADLHVMSGEFLEKAPGMKLSLRSKAQAVLTENFDWSSFDIQKGIVEIDELLLNLTATYRASQRSIGLKWMNSPQDMKGFHFPIRGISTIPVKGIVEAQGNLNTEGSDGIEAGWKLSFNNLKIDPRAIKNVFSENSKGEVTLSFVSEGAYSNGLISTPRTELQINASAPELELSGGKFIKPMGDPVNLLMKATVQNDVLDVSRAEVNFNNMALIGTIRFGSLMKYIRSELPGQLSFNAQSNAVDLTKWSSYVPMFRQIPLEGLVQFSATADGPVLIGDLPFRDLGWRIDRINMSKVKGAFDRDSFIRMGYKTDELSMAGPFNFDFLLQGRGKGSVVERGTLLAQADFSRVFISAGDHFKKTAGIPMFLDVSSEQISNRFSVKRGQLKIHKLDLGFSGNLLQGSRRNSIDVRFGKPLDLQEWRDLIPKIPQEYPFAGQINLAARMGFDRAGVMEGNLDWRKLSLDGELSVDGLGLKLSTLKNAITQGNGKILVEGNSVLIPGFNFKLGPSKFNLSARGTTRAVALSKMSPSKAVKAASAVGNLGLLFGRDSWDISGTLNADEISPRVFELDRKKAVNSTADSQPELYQMVHWLANSEKYFGSKVKLVLAAKQSNGERFKSESFSGILNWDKGTFRADPFVAKAFGGDVSGSLLYDLNPLVLRKDPPIMNLNFKFKQNDARKIMEYLKPEFSSVIDAKLNGSGNLVMMGDELESLHKSAKGRIVGTLTQFSWSSLQPLNKEIDSFFNHPEARDYLIRRSNRSQCFKDPASGRFDVQWGAGGLEIEDSELAYTGGSFVKIVGDVDTAGNTRMSGEFLPSSSCLFVEARTCLESSTANSLSFPFSMTGTLKVPVVKSQMAERASDFGDCMSRKIAKRAQAAALSEDSVKKDEEKRQRIKSLLKGN
jgi:hypothetical protein